MTTLTGVSPKTVSFSAQTSVTVTHTLSYEPWVQVLDANGVVMGTPYVKHLDTNRFTVTFASAETGTILYR